MLCGISPSMCVPTRETRAQPVARYSLAPVFFPDWVWNALQVPMQAFFSLKTILRVHLGDGVTRVRAGERLEDATPAQTVARLECALPEARHFPNRGCAITGLKSRIIIDSRLGPDATFFEADSGVGVVVEDRRLYLAQSLEDLVLVFQEGLALPTGTLLHAVNCAHAVLVVGDRDEYFYLRDDFVLSTREEKALVEWGVGRPLLANSLLAIGGTLLVGFAEEIWGPAVVGTLLVAAAEYRIQGALTKVLRVRSPEWKSGYKLVPSGIHGVERVVQGVLVTLVALADLLDHRWLLLAALILASVQVVMLEYEGQARLTWGRKTYNSYLYVQLKVWTFYVAGLVAWLWLSYVFAGFFGCFLIGLLLVTLFAMTLRSLYEGRRSVCGTPCSQCLERVVDGMVSKEVPEIVAGVVILGSVGLGLWAAVEGWDDADLKFSPQSLQPWRWPLVEPGPDSFLEVVRVMGLWLGLGVACFVSVYIAVGVLSFRISSDGSKVVGTGERILAREEHPSHFSHYRDSSVPSRNLLLQETRDVENHGRE